MISASVPALITWNSHTIPQGNYFLSVTLKSQEPHNDMAYLLVHTEGDSEAESYGMAGSVDKSPSGLGIHDGGGIRDFVCLHLQWTQLALCFCTVI